MGQLINQMFLVQAEVMKSEIDQHQDRIEQVKQWVLEAQYNNSSLKRLQMLLEEVKQVQALVKVRLARASSE